MNKRENTWRRTNDEAEARDFESRDWDVGGGDEAAIGVSIITFNDTK